MLKFLILFYITWCVLYTVCSACDESDVAVYRVTLKTLWSEDRFPKDYPLYRPKAQWAPLFGQSHNASYTLYHIGDVAKPSILKYAQFGHISELIVEGDAEEKVFDQFHASAIGSGVGETGNIVFLDGGHSLVSAISRIVPSPDWFVGVDSINLCVESGWVEQMTLDLDPLDAGAASGLTFTAPRWETVPSEPVTKHGPRSPNHPSAGFYYPELKELPVIAKMEFTKLKEYSTKDLNELTKKLVLKELTKTPEDMDMERSSEEEQMNESDEKETQEKVDITKEDIAKMNYNELKNLEEDPVGTPKPGIPENYVEVVTRKMTTTTTTEAEFEADLRSMDDVVLAVANGRTLGLGKHLPRHFRSRLHHAVNKMNENDCVVSEWGEWGACSTTCGFGSKRRVRQVLRSAKPGGRRCPELNDITHCGDANSCLHVQYFDW